MDAIGNAHEHATYIGSFLKIENVVARSVIDLGCGYGYLLKAVITEINAKKAAAVEPSEYAYDRAMKVLKDSPCKIKMHSEGLLDWLDHTKSGPVYDLGLCTSVFQYLTDDELQKVVSGISRKVRVLYLTVPTAPELKRQRVEHGFNDRYAYRRSAKFYKQIISESFTFISGRLLESKHFYGEKNTPFTDLLFRF